MAENGRLRRRCCWKRHILRALKQRDRAQEARFRDLVNAYNELLEKSSLDNFTAKLQPKSLESQTEIDLRDTQVPTGQASDSVLHVTQTLVSLKRDHEEKLETINGELAYRIYEYNILLQAKEAMLDEQRSRLASLSSRFSDLDSELGELRKQVEELRQQNSAMKEDYDVLRTHYRHQDGEFRRVAEAGLELLGGLMKKKAEAAELQNKENERAKQARVSKELEEVTKMRIGVVAELEEEKASEQEMINRDVPAQENAEKPWKRPFRSASATSMTLTRYVDVVKGLFDFRLKRGNSVRNVSQDRYCCVPACVMACLPTRVSDEQEGHASEINAIRFSPSSGFLATGGTDRLIRLWNIVGGRLENTKTLEGANGSITCLDFDPSGCHVLAATYSKAAQLWNAGESQFREVLTGHTDKVTAAKFRSTRHQAVTGSRDRTIKEWDLVKRSCYRTINTSSYCNDVVCSDTVIISGHHDRTICFWDSREPRCTQVIPVEGKVTSLSLSLDQMHLLSCSRDNALKVIDLRMHNIRQVFRTEGFKCGSEGTKAVFSPDNSYALAGSVNGTLYVWNIESGKLETSLPGVHQSSVNAVAWGPCGAYVGSVDRRRKVVLWR